MGTSVNLFELFGEGLAWSKGHEGRGVVESWWLVKPLQQGLLPPLPAIGSNHNTCVSV